MGRWTQSYRLRSRYSRVKFGRPMTRAYRYSLRRASRAILCPIDRHVTAGHTRITACSPHTSLVPLPRLTRDYMQSPSRYGSLPSSTSSSSSHSTPQQTLENPAPPRLRAPAQGGAPNSAGRRQAVVEHACRTEAVISNRRGRGHRLSLEGRYGLCRSIWKHGDVNGHARLNAHVRSRLIGHQQACRPLG